MSNPGEPTLAELMHSQSEMTRAVASCLTALINDFRPPPSPPPEVVVTYRTTDSYSSQATMAFARKQLKLLTGLDAGSIIAEAMGLPKGRRYTLSAVFFSMPTIDPTTALPPTPAKIAPNAWSELVPRIKSLEIR